MKRLSKKKKIILVLVLVVILGGVSAFLLTKNKDEPPKVAEPAKKYYSQLTGNEVTKEVSELPILGVMIENSEEARPQEGLDSAGIVFETVTEGGITRYLALYQENLPVEVGPVRSVRPYFVDWLMGFDASVAHVGGSAQALDMINQRRAKSMNQFFNDGPYYRRNDREAPHNMFARTKDLVALQKELGHKTAVFKEIPRSNDSPAATPTAIKINLNFSHPIFIVVFTYDATTNSYLRNLAGAPHIDAANNKQISVKNLVVLKMSGEINALASGNGTLFKDGVSQSITWKQTDYKSRIQLTDANGNEVQLNRGDTWISVLPGSGSVNVQ